MAIAVLAKPKAKAPQRRGEDGVMPVTQERVRVFQHIPPLLAMMLSDLGKLPPIPNEPRGGLLGFRKPGLSDMEAVKWLAEWHGSRVDEQGFRRVAGLASYRDFYDHHTSSDVRELCAIRGSRRAVVELTRWLRDDAEAQGRRLIGAIERNDLGLGTVMSKLGGHPVARDLWEYEPCHS